MDNLKGTNRCESTMTTACSNHSDLLSKMNSETSRSAVSQVFIRSTFRMLHSPDRIWFFSLWRNSAPIVAHPVEIWLCRIKPIENIDIVVEIRQPMVNESVCQDTHPRSLRILRLSSTENIMASSLHHQRPIQKLRQMP